MSDTSLRFNFLEGRDTASPGMRRVAANATAMSVAVRVASALSVVAMLTFGAAVLGLVAHVIALGQSLVVASQAVAVFPAMLAGLIAVAVGGISVFRGLGEAWKATGLAAQAGGGAAADTAHRIQLAHRSVRDATQALTDAQREALAAQEAVTRAREDAAERLADLSRALRGARLDERSAVLAMQDAVRRLRAARGSGEAGDVKRAQLAYEQSVLTLEEVRDHVEDLSKEKTEADAKGVEGSEQVQTALQRQEQTQRALVAATERLADAQRELAQAGKGVGGAADKAREALAKLAPSAAAVVLAMHELGPSWTAARRAAQQATFEGVAGDIKALSAVYLPSMTSWLGRTGAAFNEAFRGTLQLTTTARYARDVDSTLQNIATATMILARALRPVINGLNQFVTIGATFLPGMARSVGNVAERFEAWAVAARESGRMQQWMSDGMATLGQFWQLAKNLVGSLLAIFKAGENTATLDGLVKATAAMRAWLESAEGQRKVGEVLAYLRDIFTNIIQIVPVLINESGGLKDIMAVTGVVIGFVADHLDLFAKLLPIIVSLYVAWKASQLAVNAATIALIPLRVAEFVANIRNTAALRAHTAAMMQNMAASRASALATATNTVATTAGDVATKRSLISMAAMRIAKLAGAAANAILAISEWAALLPILLIIAVIALLVIGFLYLWNHSEGFRKFFIGMWHGIWGFLKEIGHWFVDDFAGFFVKAWHMIEAAFKWENFVAAFKTAVNWLIKGWNALDFGIHLHLPSWAGGYGLDVDDIIPDIPYLDTGGRIKQTGIAVVHKGEEVSTPAEVESRDAGGGGDVVVLRAGDAFWDMVIEGIRKSVRDRGGDVQFVLGR